MIKLMQRLKELQHIIIVTQVKKKNNKKNTTNQLNNYIR